MKAIGAVTIMTVCLGPPAVRAQVAGPDSSRFRYEVTSDLAVRVARTRDLGPVRLVDLTYRSPRGGRVTAFLVTPRAGGLVPAILFGHWGYGNRTEFLPEALLYARAGVASLMIDYPWVRPAPWRRSLAQGVGDPDHDLDLFVQAVVDLRRGIDLLTSYAHADPGRIAYVGHSFGAQWGAILSAVDDRICAAVLMAGIPDDDAIYLESDDPAYVALRESTPAAALRAYLDTTGRAAAVRYVPFAAPTPLLFQFARYERYFDTVAMRRLAAAASEPKRVEWYDTGHELNDPRALLDRAAWLERWLRVPLTTALHRVLGGR